MHSYYIQYQRPHTNLWIDLSPVEYCCKERAFATIKAAPEGSGARMRVVERINVEVSEYDFTYDMDGSVIKIGDILPTDFIHDVEVVGFTTSGKIVARCLGSGQDREFSPDELGCSWLGCEVREWLVRANDNKGGHSWLTSWSEVDGADYSTEKAAAAHLTLEDASEISRELAKFAIVTHQPFTFTVIHTGGLS